MNYKKGLLNGLEGWYRLEAGLVRVYRLTPDGDAVTCRLLFAGDLFHVPPYHEQRDDLEAVTGVEVLFMGLDAPDDWAIVTRNLQAQLDRSGYERYLSGQPVRDSLLLRLKHLCSAPGIAHLGHGGTVLPLSHEKIAEAVGASRETVTRGLRDLSDEGLVKVRHGAVVLL